MSMNIGLAKSVYLELADGMGLVTPQRGEKRKSLEETVASTLAVNTLYDSHNTTSRELVGLNSKIIDPHSLITKKHKIEFYQWQKGYIDTSDSGKERFLSQACNEFELLYYTYSSSSDEEIKNKLFNELFSSNLVRLVFKNPKILPQLEKELAPLSYSTLIVIIFHQASKNEEEFINIIKQNPSLFKEMSLDAWRRIPKETKAIVQEIVVQYLVANPNNIQNVAQCDTTDLRNINNWWTSVRCRIRSRLAQLSFPSTEKIANLGQTPEGMLVFVFNDIMKDEETFTRALEQVENCARYQKEAIAAIDLNTFASLSYEQKELLKDQFHPQRVLENNPKVFSQVNHLNMRDPFFPFYYLVETSIAKYIEKNPEVTFKELQERLTPSEEGTIQGLTNLMGNLDITNQCSDQLRNVIYDVVMEPFLDLISPEFFDVHDPYAEYQIHHLSNHNVLRFILKEAVQRNPLLLNNFRAFITDYWVSSAACSQQRELLQLIDEPLMALRILQELAESAGAYGLTGDVIISNYAFLSDKVKHDTAFWKHILLQFPESLDRFIPYLPNAIRQGREKSWRLWVTNLQALAEEAEREARLNENIATLVERDDGVSD